jgi:uncharacterized membrane-anchored protein
VIATLYRSRITSGAILLMIVAALVALATALLVSDAGDAAVTWLTQSWRALLDHVMGWLR